ncbi:hypothetical protein ACUOA5_38255, partial [Escherichia coli]
SAGNTTNINSKFLKMRIWLCCAILLPDAETYSLIVLHVKKKNISSTGQNTHFQKLAIDVGSVASGLNRNAVSR